MALWANIPKALRNKRKHSESQGNILSLVCNNYTLRSTWFRWWIVLFSCF